MSFKKANKYTKAVKKEMPSAITNLREDMKMTRQLAKRAQEIFEYLDKSLTKVEERLGSIEDRLEAIENNQNDKKDN